MYVNGKWQIIAAAVIVMAYSGSAVAQTSYGLNANSLYGNNNSLNKPNSLANSSYAAGMNSQRSASTFGAGTGGLANKPFSTLQPQQAVSPYLNLFRTDANGQVNQFNYSTLVQPQLQQQQVNDQVQRQALQTARRLQAISAQPNFNPQGSKDEYPTGHETVFNYKGHYYATPRQHAKKAATVQ
jgi:hypothetical protein